MCYKCKEFKNEKFMCLNYFLGAFVLTSVGLNKVTL